MDQLAHSGFRSNNSEYGFDHFTSGSNDPDPIVGYPDVINEDPGPSNLAPNLIFLDPEPLRGAGLYIFTLLIPDLDDILFLDTDPCVTQRLNPDIVYIYIFLPNSCPGLLEIMQKAKFCKTSDLYRQGCGSGFQILIPLLWIRI